MIETTRDALLGGRVPYEQPARGYRVALEAPLLARFAVEGRARPFASFVDLGAGPGAVGLCLAATGWALAGAAVEIDPDHAELARRNLAGHPVDVLEADVAHVRELAAELVIANPPWFEPGAGGLAEAPGRAGARAFTRGTLRAFIAAARRLLAPRGRVVVSMPSSRLVETLDELARSGLHAKRVRFVHPRAGEEADVVFIEAKVAKPGGLVVERPLYVRGAGEAYTDEARATLFGLTEAWGTAGAAGPSSARAGGPDRA